MTAITEHLTGHAHFGFDGYLLYAIKSDHQVIEVWETSTFGKVLMIDGVFQTSEAEEFIYHECMVHPAASLTNVKTALVVGGGDGGIARELLKRTDIVTIAELDSEVVRVSRDYMGIDRGALSSEKVRIIIGDGLETAKALCPQDLIVLDLTDPGTTADSLYGQEALQTFKECLAPEGVMVLHLGSPVFHKEQVRDLHARLASTFEKVQLMGAYIPLYGSYWLMAIVGADNSLNMYDPSFPFDARYLDRPAYTNLINIPKWFNPTSNGFW